jgi:hypothetical protein
MEREELARKPRTHETRYAASLVGAISGLLVYADATTSTKQPPAGAMLGVLVGGVWGLDFYK